jgi:hypothetical protein
MMADESLPHDKQQPLEIVVDHTYESRHELVAELAYRLWEQRGRPVGSPDVDWHAAEQALYASLVESGLITPSSDHPRNMREEIYQPPAE